MVILIAYGMMYFTMEAVFVVCTLAMKLTLVHMCVMKGEYILEFCLCMACIIMGKKHHTAMKGGYKEY